MCRLRVESPFVHGSKGIGDAALETLLFLNGFELCPQLRPGVPCAPTGLGKSSFFAPARTFALLFTPLIPGVMVARPSTRRPAPCFLTVFLPKRS